MAVRRTAGDAADCRSVGRAPVD